MVELEIYEAFLAVVPRSRDEATALYIQGHGQVWETETEKTIKNVRRISTAGQRGFLTLGDLWRWQVDRWHTTEELEAEYGLAHRCALMLSKAVALGIKPGIQEAMMTPYEWSKGH